MSKKFELSSPDVALILSNLRQAEDRLTKATFGFSSSEVRKLEETIVRLCVERRKKPDSERIQKELNDLLDEYVGMELIDET